MSKARTLANFVSSGNPLADGAIAASEVTGLSTVATTGAYNDLSGKPTLGTAAAQNTGTFLQTANNLSDVTAATARTNLGLATVAATGSYNDLSNKPTITTTATNIAGGSNGTIPYQSAEGTTQMLAAGTAGQVLTSAGAAAPTWATPAPGAGTVTAVASGSLSDGSAVILNSNGTVSIPEATSASTFTSTSQGQAGTPTVYLQSYSAAGAFGVTDNCIVVFYLGASDRYLYAVAGKVSGGSITFGTPQVQMSSMVQNGDEYGVTVAWDSTYNRYHCLFRQSSAGSYGTNAYVTINSSTLAITGSGNGTATWASGKYPTGFGFISSASSNQGLVVYGAGSDNYTYAQGITFSNSYPYMSIGSATLIDGYPAYYQMIPAFNANATKAVIPYSRSSGNAAVALMSCSGTSLSLDSLLTLTSDNTVNCPKVAAYSPAIDKFVVAWGNPSTYTIKGAVITVSGSSLSAGTPVSIGGLSATSFPYSLTYYPLTGDFWFSSTRYYCRLQVSGTTFTASTNTQMNSTETATYASAFYDSVNGTICQVSTGNSTYKLQLSEAKAYTTTLTSTNFLGFSNAAYTNGQTATIQTVGSTDDAQSGLTAGLKYYVADNGVLTSASTSQPYAGIAMSSTKLVIKG